MEDLYTCTYGAIDAADNSTIFNNRGAKSSDDPQPTNNTVKAPVSSALRTTTDEVSVAILDQSIIRVEKDIGEVSEKIHSIGDLDGHSLSS